MRYLPSTPYDAALIRILFAVQKAQGRVGRAGCASVRVRVRSEARSRADPIWPPASGVPGRCAHQERTLDPARLSSSAYLLLQVQNVRYLQVKLSPAGPCHRRARCATPLGARLAWPRLRYSKCPPAAHPQATGVFRKHQPGSLSNREGGGSKPGEADSLNLGKAVNSNLELHTYRQTASLSAWLIAPLLDYTRLFRMEGSLLWLAERNHVSIMGPGGRMHNGANHPIRHRQAIESDRHWLECRRTGPPIEQNNLSRMLE